MKYTEVRKRSEGPSDVETLQCLLEAASDRLHRHVSRKVFTSSEDTDAQQEEPESCPPERGLIYF
jgi:hypothetical protein